MTCHFNGKQEECDKPYQKAIKKNEKLQGVHASYGTHLLKRGDLENAKQEFAKEITYHPTSEKTVNLAFKQTGKPDSSARNTP